ncbi:hypothetical protein HK097_008548 [Rhizophlyctis rosea]|uniref:Methanethiol oxidase n=1 Tax=Rhizophlyctis rosea TaxID=64517 RepID=A0AAD5X3W3_9FUNG|nr:hypothetical protein HK097_008548 [Rhizophlyctis rosea]
MKISLACTALFAAAGFLVNAAPNPSPQILGSNSGIIGLLPNTPISPVSEILTPPLDIAFTPSTLKPKKLIYTWTGADDRHHKDFLATFSGDDDTFGTLIDVTTVPTSGNEPHHIGVSVDGNTIIGGGLLSLLKLQDTAYYFDISNKWRPRFKKSNRAVLSSIVDEVRAKPDGGFFITYMGSAAGTAPGRLVETDKDFNIIGEHPQDLSQIDILFPNFNPHGLAIDFERNVILTSDFAVPLTTLKPTTGVVYDSTVRVWDLAKRSITNTINLPNGGGIQDVKFIPGNKQGLAVATAVGTGDIWIIDPHTKDAQGKPGVATLLYAFGSEYANKNAIYTEISKDGKFLYLTITSAHRVAVLDISNPFAAKRVDDPNVPQPIVGPHYLKLTPDGKQLIITDYFVRQGALGVLNTAADYKLWAIDVNPATGALSFKKSIDFQTTFKWIGGARPHSSAYYDSTWKGEGDAYL